MDLGSLAEALSRLAHDLDQPDDPETLLDVVVRGAIALVPGAEEGSISLPADPRAVTGPRPSVAPTPMAGVLALPLSARGAHLGVLTLSARTPDAFTAESERVGALYAGHAASAIGRLRTQAQLQDALRSRDLIGQAKGILMERYGVGSDDAFRTLVRISQHTNRKTYAIADELVRTRELAARRDLLPAAENRL